MVIRVLLSSIGVLVILAASGFAADAEPTLRLSSDASEFVWQEPILVRVELPGDTTPALPAVLGDRSSAILRFEINPPIPPRPGAKPLPQEAAAASPGVKVRDYDLVEWFRFPNEAGSWTIRAVYEADGRTLTSAPLSIAVTRPAKGDTEFDATARLHHLPWSNYESNAFCGDTFDVVKKWPDSRLAKYCHYWSGRYLQTHHDYAKAIASFRAAAAYPGFALADDATRGIAECENALSEAKRSTGHQTDPKPTAPSSPKGSGS
jgi:hypothetical protein